MSRALCDEQNLKRAVNAAVQYGWSKKSTTLIRHVDGASKGEGVEKRLGRPRLLNKEEELELSTLIQDMESRLYGLSESDIEKFVYNYCHRIILSERKLPKPSIWHNIDLLVS